MAVTVGVHFYTVDLLHCNLLCSTSGGPGTYTVVHCGAAGHNIRTKPGMKGVPVGRLAKGSSIEVIEEVCY